MITNFNLDLSAYNKYIPKIIHMMQFETGRQLTITIDVDAISSAELWILRPDKTHYMATCLVNGHTIVCEIPDDFLSVVGNAICQLKLFKSDEWVNTFSFILAVEISAEGTISEKETTILTEWFANEGQALLDEWTQESKEAIEQKGQETIYSIPEDYTKLSDSITNIIGYDFNVPILWTDGYYVDKNNGNLVQYASWKVSQPIEVTKNMNIISTAESSYNAFYSANNEFLSAVTIHIGNNTDFQRANGSYYIRLSLPISADASIIQMPNKTVLEMTDKKIRVATMNLGHFWDGITPGVPNNVLYETRCNWERMLGNADADIICGQEWQQYFDRNNTQDSLVRVFSFKYPYRYGGDDKMIVSKDYRDNVTFHNFNGFTGVRGYLKTYIRKNKKKICIINAHLSIESDYTISRKAQYQELKAIMDSEEYCIVFGDFNAFSVAEFDELLPYKRVNNGNFGNFDTWYNFGQTHPTWKNKVIDNIIYTNNLSLQNVRMSDWNTLSDHVMLIADFEIS